MKAKNRERTCRNCGEKFQANTRGQDCCSSNCRVALRTFGGDRCQHEWGDNNGRSYCMYCGEDGDA